jgi:hypothetical protein
MPYDPAVVGLFGTVVGGIIGVAGSYLSGRAGLEPATSSTPITPGHSPPMSANVQSRPQTRDSALFEFPSPFAEGGRPQIRFVS